MRAYCSLNLAAVDVYSTSLFNARCRSAEGVKLILMLLAKINEQ